MENPLLNLHQLSNDEFIPFDIIKDEHFEPAFAVAFAAARENLLKMIDNSEEPTFENTIEAIEDCAEQLNVIIEIFFHLKGAKTSPEIERVAKIIAPQIADWGNDLLLNEKLFQRVKKLYELKPILHTKEQERLFEKTYSAFIRNGALLDEPSKQLLRTYDQKLQSLIQSFSEHLLNATNAYQLIIENEEDLKGLPESAKEAAKEEAQKRGLENAWVFTLKDPSVSPFMKYGDSETIRKDLSFALGSRAMSGENNNQPVVLEIVDLKDKKAKLLGYKSFAHFVLEKRMAKNPETVYAFFDSLYPVARKSAEKDFEKLRTLKESLTGDKILNTWDTAYYSEKIKLAELDFNEEDIRPYFKLETVIEGVFEHARRLYDLSFKKREDIPLYHSDVLAYEVRDKDGSYLGMVYFDPFPRESKRQGAWVIAPIMQHKKNGIDSRPHMFIVGNLTKPTATLPSLLNVWEMETIFHEFGHALSILLSDCTYASLAGYNTLWDFVELPSQFMQAFILNKDSVKLVGRHYETGEIIPDDLIEKIIKVKKFMTGWTMLAQLGASVLDMKWHDGSGNGVINIEAFEAEVREKYRLFRHYPGTSSSVAFYHIFTNDYNAGYYSYHWSEVLAADAFEYFKENGLFNKEIAQKFRDDILSKGNTEDPMELYKKFRGREPDPHALLRLKGLE